MDAENPYAETRQAVLAAALPAAACGSWWALRGCGAVLGCLCCAAAAPTVAVAAVATAAAVAAAAAAGPMC